MDAREHYLRGEELLAAAERGTIYVAQYEQYMTLEHNEERTLYAALASAHFQAAAALATGQQAAVAAGLWEDIATRGHGEWANRAQ